MNSTHARMSSVGLVALLFLSFALPATPSAAQSRPECEKGALPELPDVTITSVNNETVPVPHCKLEGTIGTETNFELLLPDDWNGKFVMGGGGGFVGSAWSTLPWDTGCSRNGYRDCRYGHGPSRQSPSMPVGPSTTSSVW